MKFLVIGGGSMGKRRVRCLLANEVKPDQIRMVDVREDRRAEVKSRHDVDGFGDLQSGMKWQPDALIVSVPGFLHMEACLAAAREKKHFFVEVPLAMSLDGTAELAQLVEKNRIVAAPGVQPPFHPMLKQFKQWIDDPAFGKTLGLIAEFGQYLPDWHPYEDYRKFYAANQKMGGGNLDVIAQELATFYWLLGDRATDVFCRGRKLSTLEIEANDCWDIIATLGKGGSMNMHADMIQRVGRNVIRAISETGTIELDLVAGQIRRFQASTKQWESRSVPSGYLYEQCYIDEIGLFLKCLRGEAKWHNPLSVATDIVKFILALEASAQSGRVEKV